MPVRVMLCGVLLWLTAFAGSPLAAGESDTASPPPAMSLSQAAILGVVEGLTEYLPVSSTGHLLLAEKIMGIGAGGNLSPAAARQRRDAIDAYIICIQAGAIIAVLGLYFRRVRQMLGGLLGNDPLGRRLLLNVLAGFVPAAVIGLLANKQIKAWLFGPWPVVAAWLAGGLIILAVHWWSKGRARRATVGCGLEEMSWRMALVVGLIQCVAMWPGVSRSLVTIVGGVLTGLSLPAAVEFSFLLGVVTLGAATAYDALKHGQDMLASFSPAALLTGLIFAFVSAVAAIRWMVSYLNNHGMAIFGYYRVVLALTVGYLLATGRMS